MKEFEHKIRKEIPFGFSINDKSKIEWKRITKAVNSAMDRLCSLYPKFADYAIYFNNEMDLEKWCKRVRIGYGDFIKAIGSVGGGNHFVEYDANAELHEQIDVIHKAITQASVIVSEGVEEENKADVEFGFVLDLVEALTTAIVNGILSPKVLMLLEVNQKMMGGTWEKFTLEDLLRALESTIIAIVKEVRDLILQELLKLLEETLAPLKETVLHLLVREQLEYYSDAIMDIIRNCPSIWFRFGNTYEDTKLDTVDYADIDVSHTKEGEQPSTNKC